MKILCKKTIVFLPIPRSFFKVLPDTFRYGSGAITSFNKNQLYNAENISYYDWDNKYRVAYYIWSKDGQRCYFGHAGYSFLEFFYTDKETRKIKLNKINKL